MIVGGFSLNRRFRDITSIASPLDTPVSGADQKIWVTIDGSKYLLKLDRSKAITEHVGSTFFNCVGVPTQNTELVLYNGNLSCLISDVVGDKVLRTFKCVHDSSLWYAGDESEDRFYTFFDIVDTIDHYGKADKNFITALYDQFIRMFIVDAIIANRDRHGGNWGYLVDGDDRELVPVFDNGACLFPDLASFVDIDRQQFRRLVFEVPRSQVQLVRGKKNNFYRIFEELRGEVNASWLTRDKVEAAISTATVQLDSERRAFYSKLVLARYDCIICGRPFVFEE